LLFGSVGIIFLQLGNMLDNVASVLEKVFSDFWHSRYFATFSGMAKNN
jgi:hypothetical protein